MDYVGIRLQETLSGITAVIQAGGIAQARLQVAPGIWLARLTQTGEEPLAWSADNLELAVAGQDAIVIRMIGSF
jgi:hypothetical protein